VNVVVELARPSRDHLPAFKAAVQKGKVWGLMGAYNLYRNQHNCHNDYLLNQVLKRDWKFDGVVVSDWGGVHDTKQAIENGLDMEFGTWTDGLTMGATMPTTTTIWPLPTRSSSRRVNTPARNSTRR
jgi:beta-glucosidase